MEELRQTTVTPQSLPPDSGGFNLGTIFANKDRFARLCLFTALASLVCTGIALFALFSALQAKNRVTVLDENGTIRVGSEKNIADAQELQQQTALSATSALLSRNSQNFDDPELLQLYFSKNALVRAAALKLVEAKQFDELKIEQKPHVARIDIRQAAKGEFRARVTGELSRTGVFEERPFSDPLPFTLELVLRRNTDLMHNRLQPLIVSEFTLNYDPKNSN